jgi:hypothetical protein
MESVKPPSGFNIDADNLNEEWKSFKQEMKFYLMASEKDGKSDGIKTSLLLHCMGKEAIQVYNTLTFDPATDNMVYEKVVERYIFFTKEELNSFEI